jgi:outer membrane protein insertion porin family
VIVSVEELPATSISYGAGFEGGRRALQTAEGLFQDKVVVAPRGFFEIGRRNLWGKNRSIDFFSRVAPQLAKTTAGNFGFVEYRVSGTYREPNAFNSAADALLGITSEQAARTGFNYERNGANVQFIRRVSSHVSLSGRYGLDRTRIFDFDASSFTPFDRITIDKLFPQVRLSIVSASIVWDRRDDLVAPSHGTLASADVELAARRLGSEVGFSRVFLQASRFHALSATRRVVLAGRAEVGMARGFERQKVNPDTGQLVTVADLPVSQRFFAGGSTTVRGFQLDRLGVPAILTADGLSLGGNGVVILNAELRTTLHKLFSRDFGIALFSDAGNVFGKAADIDLTQLRTAVGFGFRYNSPIGPVRLDFGFKTDRQIVGSRRESGWEYHLNIGEAF